MDLPELLGNILIITVYFVIGGWCLLTAIQLIFKRTVIIIDTSKNKLQRILVILLLLSISLDTFRLLIEFAEKF